MSDPTPAPVPPTAEQHWKLFAQAERLASDARQLRREAQDLAGTAEDLERRADRLQDLAEAIARDADPRPPLTGE
jgi:hypothetical protein